MQMRKCIIAIIVLLLAASAEVNAFSHGFPTNPNVLFPLLTFKNIKTDYGASCDGSGTNDTTAFTGWLSQGILQGANQVGLIIPPGAKCVGCEYVFDGTQGGNGIQNAVIWAFGATCISTLGERIGSSGFYEDTTHSSLIQTANLNDAFVTLITSSESSRYAVNDYLLIGALELQEQGGGNSFPPNFQFYQFVQITAINAGTGVISITPPVNSTWFKSTYPSILSDSAMPNNGPASIFKMQPNWNTTLQIFGLNTAINGPIAGTQDSMSGRNVSCTLCTFGSINTSATVCQSCSFLSSSTNGQEVDKDIVNFTISNSTIHNNHNLTFQSPTPQNAVVNYTNVTGTLNGFPLNGTFANSTFGAGVVPGTTNYGHVNNNNFINNTFPSARIGQHFVSTSLLTYNNDGTFSILKSNPNYYLAVAWAVPGFQYAFADGDGTLNSTPVTKFTINDVTDQGTSIKIWTTLPNTLPTPTCNLHACPVYQAYAGGVITQTPAGVPVDLTQFAP
jgi:hypothetical protein